MPAEAVRIGLIGAGRNTRERHIPGFQEVEGVELAAVANRSRQSGRQLARVAGRPEFGCHLHRHLALHALDADDGRSGKREARAV